MGRALDRFPCMFDRIMGTPSFDRVECLYQGKCDQLNDLDSSRDKPSIWCLIFADSLLRAENLTTGQNCAQTEGYLGPCQ